MNILVSIKRFFTNKNVVTVIGIVLIIFLLYWGYNKAIQTQVSPVTGIPIAKEKILPGTLITNDMIDVISVAPVVLQKGDVYTSKSQIVGSNKKMYSNYDTAIPKGSMFYKSAVITEDQLPNSALIGLNSDEVLYNLPVNIRTTFGNIIMPDSYIDIYLKATETNKDTGEKEVIYGKFIENIKVLAVKDANGNDVFANSEDKKSPAMMLFGLQPSINILLNKASYLTQYAVEIVPVPHGADAQIVGDKKVSSEYLREFISSKSVELPENDVPEEG